MDVSRETGSSSDLSVTTAAGTGSAAELFGAGWAIAQAYAEALSTSGVERGLIGPREVPRLWHRHLLNCVVLEELIPSGVDLADVGSGAGLPGMPLAIARPDLSVSLIEPLLRRVVWLREIVPALGITNVEVIRARANAVVDTGQRFDVVTARAVLPLPGLLALCLPLLKAGGMLLAIKGDSADAELLAAKEVLKELGASDWGVVLCGEGLLEVPTKVVRVVAGRHGRAGPGGPIAAFKLGKHPGAAKGAPAAKSVAAAKSALSRSSKGRGNPAVAAKSAAAAKPAKSAKSGERGRTSKLPSLEPSPSSSRPASLPTPAKPPSSTKSTPK